MAMGVKFSSGMAIVLAAALLLTAAPQSAYAQGVRRRITPSELACSDTWRREAHDVLHEAEQCLRVPRARLLSRTCVM